MSARQLYFVQHDGATDGPLTAEQVRQRLGDRTLAESDKVRLETHEDWEPLFWRKEFQDLCPSQTGIKPRRNPMTMAIPIVAIVSVVLLGLLAVAMYKEVNGRSHISTAISNCRQIITTLRLYASEHNYGPDDDSDSIRSKGRTTSNEVFRELIKAGYADNEMIFGCPESDLGRPDGNIGKPPDFLEAVKPGENHWALTVGLNDSASGSYPLIYENPSEATWPPKWSPGLAGTGKPGRTWPGGKIIIGMNDSSVALQKCASDKGENVGLLPLPERADGKGVDLFSQNGPPNGLRVLNAAK